MADSFETLTIEDLTELIVASALNLLPEDDYSSKTDNWKRARLLAGVAADLHAHIDTSDRDVLPDTAKGVRLVRWGNMLKLPQLGATKASAENAGKIRGSNGSTWLTTDLLEHKSGRQYAPTAGGTVGVTEEALVGVIALVAGSEGTLEAGEILTWVSAPSGLEDEVELQIDLEPGLDVESEGSFRNRILNRLALGARGGTPNDYEQWALESSADIGTAYVWPNRNGAGSVDVAGLKAGSGSTRLLDAGERSALATYLEGVRPIHRGVRVLEVVAVAQNVTGVLTPESASQHARDWEDSTPLVVSTWTAGTRTLKFTTDRPASMDVGHRIIIDSSTGLEEVIESLSGTDSVVLKSPVSATPANPDNVYSGGPLIAPARAAAQALFDDLGPRRGVYGASKRGTLYLAELFEMVQTSEGVLNTVLSTPAADVTPAVQAYPDDDKVNLLIAGNLFFRYS